MTRRSMPSSFHANLFALVPARCPSSTCGVATVVIGAALGDVPFLPAVGDTPLVHMNLSPLFSVASWVLGKMRAGIWANSGSQFPDGVGCGKCDPEYCSKTGCRFPNGAQPENASQFEVSKRDAFSARQHRRDLAARQLRYSPKISAASSSWVSTT